MYQWFGFWWLEDDDDDEAEYQVVLRQDLLRSDTGIP